MVRRQNPERVDDTIPHLEIRMVPSEFIYPFQGEWWDLLGERRQFDVVIHAIALLNLSSQTISVETVAIEGTDQGDLLHRTVFYKEEIEQWAKPVVTRNQIGLRRIVDLILWTDHVVSSEQTLTSSAEIEPGQVLIIPNIYLMFTKKPDRLKVIAAAAMGGTRETAEATLSVVEYANQSKYRIPLEGRWLMKATPNTGVLDHHRFGVSNEFGVDFLRPGPQGELFRNDGKQSSDYYSYGEKVLAAAEGKVVAVVQGEVQEWSRFNPREGETEKQFQERQLKEVQQALQGDVGRWAAGNHIVIEHAVNEHSAYLHLRENSARVKKGDFVRPGQHIADVGNTGDSFGAHLHFQVIDRPDLVRGRSLPFTFENISASLSEPGWLVQAVE